MDSLQFFCKHHACARDIFAYLSKRDFLAFTLVQRDIHNNINADMLLHCMMLKQHYNIRSVGAHHAQKLYAKLRSTQKVEFEDCELQCGGMLQSLHLIDNTLYSCGCPTNTEIEVRACAMEKIFYCDPLILYPNPNDNSPQSNDKSSSACTLTDCATRMLQQQKLQLVELAKYNLQVSLDIMPSRLFFVAGENICALLGSSTQTILYI
jgi:hypothetical protein